MSSIWDMTLQAFRDATAADSSTPSCGAAAVVAATMGSALILMALRISETKSADPARAELIERVEKHMKTLSAYADADVKAFERYMQAARLPEHTGQREVGVQRAAVGATQVPLDTAKTCVELLGLAEEGIPFTSDNVQSDILSGSLLLQGGLSAVLLNVDANTELLDEDGIREQAIEKRQQLEQQASKCLQLIRQALQDRQ
jgi:formiminotetrahydrofolate cyclodeaminase